MSCAFYHLNKFPLSSAQLESSRVESIQLESTRLASCQPSDSNRSLIMAHIVYIATSAFVHVSYARVTYMLENLSNVIIAVIIIACVDIVVVG